MLKRELGLKKPVDKYGEGCWCSGVGGKRRGGGEERDRCVNLDFIKTNSHACTHAQNTRKTSHLSQGKESLITFFRVDEPFATRR